MTNLTRRQALLGLGAAAVAAQLPAAALIPATPVVTVAPPLAALVPCAGQLLSAADYPLLFSVLGHRYGGADDMFRMPLAPCPVNGFEYRLVSGFKPQGHLPVGCAVPVPVEVTEQ